MKQQSLSSRVGSFSFAKTLGFVTLALGAFLSVSCAKDQDLNDFKSRQFEQDFAKIASSNGRYSGFAVSEADGKTKVGALQLTLQASSLTLPSTDQSRSTVQPVLNVNLDFQGQNLVTIHTPSGTYDPATGVFQAQIMVSSAGTSGAASSSTQTGTSSGASGTTASQTYTINLNGTLSAAGVLSGTLEAQGFPGFGFTFSLQRDGKSLTELAAQSTPTALLQHLNYQGQTVFAASGTVKNVNLTILNPTTSSEQEFLNVIVPTKTLIANLNYGADAQIPFTNATFDERTGRLEGTAVILSTIPGSTTNSSTTTPSGTASTAGNSVTMYLQCQLQSGTNGFDCQHTTNSSSASVATTRVAPASDSTPPPADDASERKQIQYQYKGTADLPVVTLPGGGTSSPGAPHHGSSDPTGSHGPTPNPGSGHTVTHNFLLSVIYQTRTRLQEIVLLFAPETEEEYVQVSLYVTDVFFGDNFVNAIFDRLAQTIQGNETFTTPGNNTPATTQLLCNNFTFNNPKTSKYKFACDYTGSLSGGTVTVSFHN